jgi:probable F420-dependent oxidoreductase
MQIGVVFPQTEIGSSVAGVRAYGLRVEELGFEHVLAYDHVLGADPEVHKPWAGPYNVHTTFHEPFVLFGYLAGFTSLEFVTGVIILPQRQTALVAKQAAEVDILTNGRFRLGVGVGWNEVEYQALGKSFTDRGQRMSEQIILLRRLFTEASVSHDGEFERVIGAGIAPLPVQRPVPIWIGGQSTPAYRRVGRLADGWFPQVRPGPKLDEARAVIEEAAHGAGRDPTAIGMEGIVSWSDAGVGKLVDQVGRWRDAGATHVAINTINAGLGSVDSHLETLAIAADALKSFRTE